MLKLSEDPVWYLVQTKSNGDMLAERNLLQQGFGVFSPKITATRWRHGRFREELRSLFPGYLFVSMSSHLARWRAIGSTLGVLRLVSFGGEGPSRVSNELIALLKRRCDDQGTMRPAQLKAGDKVRISSGPFSDFIASVESIPSDHRIWILLDIMGREQRISIAASNLERGTG